MDKITIIKVIDLINQHIKELDYLPGNPIGREQVRDELRLIIKELKEKISIDKRVE